MADRPADPKTATVSAVEPGKFARALRHELSQADPNQSDWDIERFHERAKQQLDLVGAWIFRKGSLPDGVFSTTVELPSLATWEFLTVRDRLGVQIRQGSVPEAMPSVTPDEFCASLQQECQLGDDAHFKMKVFRVEPLQAGKVTTQVLVTASGRRVDESMGQINSEWIVEWLTVRDGAPTIAKVTMTRWNTAIVAAGSDAWFEDRAGTIVAPGQADEARHQLGGGLPYWARRLDSGTRIEPTGYNGLALGDVNNDGLEDLYVCQTGGLPNRLLVQQRDGTVADRSHEAGVDFLDNVRSALIVDLDNDGDRDLLVTAVTKLVMLENDGTGKFSTRQTFNLSSSAFSMACADADRNGTLDIYICGYGEVWGGVNERGDQIPLPMHDARNGGANHFFLNHGNWQFTESSEVCGLNVNNDRWSLSVAWEDFDQDGDFDIYVANDFGRKNLYRNEFVPTGKLFFHDVAAEMGAEDLGPGMSASWGDPDNDGQPDLYVSNMFSGAGNRIAFQNNFLPGANDSVQEARSSLQRMARGNTLLRNRGTRFDDVSLDAGVTVGRWAWASQFVDIDNDGYQDILVCNGFMTGDAPDDL